MKYGQKVKILNPPFYEGIIAVLYKCHTTQDGTINGEPVNKRNTYNIHIDGVMLPDIFEEQDLELITTD